MNKPLVYLAGPITGISYAGAVDWRDYAARVLAPWGISTASPMRFKSYLKSAGRIAETYEGHPLSSFVGINLRDQNDVRRSDGLLVNFLGAGEVSRGTLIEVGFAMALNKPIIIAMENPRTTFDQIQDNMPVVIKNVHDHAMVKAHNLVVPTLDDAIECMASILAVDAPQATRKEARQMFPELLLAAGMD